MKYAAHHRFKLSRGWLALLGTLSSAPALAASSLTLAQYPLFLSTGVNPNIMVILDNSESMDGTMSGTLIAGSDPTTRANIARDALMNVINSFRTQFNWGLETFAFNGSASYNYTYVYYFGDSSTMVYTNDCVGGISASNSGRRCVANPQTGNGYGYITYDRSSDDADINDVLYVGTNYGTQLYGVGASGTNYNVYKSHGNTTSWSSFSSSLGTWSFTPTDAGFLPQSSTYPRILWLPRAWGYYADITGYGKVLVNIQTDSTSHYNSLATYLAHETSSASSSEIKNAAVFTPLTGSLITAKSYFSGNPSLQTQSCQKNYVVLATDGNPTGKTNGSQYDPSQWANSYNASTKTWTYGQAEQDVFTQINSLRSTTIGGVTKDIQTYVIGLGDTVANASSIASLNQMASLGGTTNAFLANNATALSTAFSNIAASITKKNSASSSAALNSSYTGSDVSLYQAKFSSADWSGDVLSYAIDSTTGAVSSTPTWSAGTNINALNWDTQRVVFTFNGSQGVNFRWPANPSAPTSTEISTSQVGALNTSPSGSADTYGSLRLQYLRGDKSHEVSTCGSSCSYPITFRDRSTSVLGDITDSAPVYVADLDFGYYDNMESVRYSSFVAANQSRTPMIYVGANDGMLHGINANNGNDVFDYVPSQVYAKLSKLTNAAYTHLNYVDGSPTFGDAFFGGAWHTILSSGLRSGGTGVFTLDVTNPAVFSEAAGNASQVVKWEFSASNDADMGYVYGSPLIVKVNTGRWAVIVANGYASTNDKAMLFVLDAQTGSVIAKISTGVGSSSAPNGLSGPVAVDTNGDNVADAVYAGDLQGNLWKFDLSSSNASSWGVAFSGHPLYSAGSTQAITSRPDVTKFPKGGYLVTFGTGRFITTSDTSTTPATQSIYGIWEQPGLSTPTTSGAAVVTQSRLQQQSIIVTSATGGDGNTYRMSTHAVDKPTDTLITGDNVTSSSAYYASKLGWYVNLPASSSGSATGERVISDPTIRHGRVIYTTAIPDTTACSSGGTSWIWEFNVFNGDRPDSSIFDTNKDNVLSAADELSFGGGSLSADVANGKQISGIGSSPGIHMRKDGNEDKYTNTSNGVIVQTTEAGGIGDKVRVMWQQIKSK